MKKTPDVIWNYQDSNKIVNQSKRIIKEKKKLKHKCKFSKKGLCYSCEKNRKRRKEKTSFGYCYKHIRIKPLKKGGVCTQCSYSKLQKEKYIYKKSEDHHPIQR